MEISDISLIKIKTHTKSIFHCNILKRKISLYLFTFEKVIIPNI